MRQTVVVLLISLGSRMWAPLPVPDKSDGATNTLTGTVLDAKGQQIKSGKVWLPVKWLNAWENLTASCDFDKPGPFRIAFPAKWIPSDATMRNPTLWAYAPGHAIGTASAFGQLFGDQPAKPLAIVLPPAGDLSFVVLLPNGEPAVGARVAPYHFKTHQGYDLVPRAIVELVATKTDAAGRVAMPALTRDGVYTINVEMTGLGMQQFRCDMKSTDPPEQTLRLREVGRVEGRVATDRLEQVRDMVVSIETTSLTNRNSLRDATGRAMVKVDNQGTFVIPEIAVGEVDVMAHCDDKLPVRARLPERGTIKLALGDTAKVTIPLERAIRVHGEVRTKDTQKPLAGVKVALRYGVGRQGDQATTNEKGEYSAFGLAGEAYVHLISIPKGYVQLGEPWSQRRTIPADTEDFTWPAIEVVPTVKVAGKVIDGEGKPVANVRINGVVGNRRYGFGSTDKNGAFALPGVPMGVTLERFEIWNRDDHFNGVVETKEPLVVRLRK